MVDSSGNLLHSTFSPWTRSQNITEEITQTLAHMHTHTYAQDVLHMLVVASLPTLLRQCSLLALFQ